MIFLKNMNANKDGINMANQGMCIMLKNKFFLEKCWLPTHHKPQNLDNHPSRNLLSFYEM